MPWNRKRAWLVLKSVLAVAIIVGVGAQFARILSNPQLADYRFALRVEYLLAAGLLYVAAHCCWATFWVRLLHGQGIRVSWLGGVRAYFVSQFGKYVPGKAWVILIRVAMLRAAGERGLPVAVTATYETLTSMAAGAMMGVLFLPWLGGRSDVVSGNVVFLFGIAALPLLLGVLNRLAVRVAARSRGPDASPLPSPSLFLLAQGLLYGAAGWCLLGVSLGLTIRGVTPDPPALTPDAYLGDVAAVAISYVLGFVVLVAPGGIGVRELILQEALSERFASAVEPAVAEALAAVVALTLRLVWTAAEVVAALVLYLRAPRHVANEQMKEDTDGAPA